MMWVVSLLNINFNILRSMRNALVVTGTGGSAAFIPYFELFGTFPASILLTWVLSRLLRIYSLRFIFSAMMCFFLSFFVFFAFVLYPCREQIHHFLVGKLSFLASSAWMKSALTHWSDLLFYILSELWKVALLSVLFWGFLNQKLSMGEAKRFYPPLMLGSSIGTILAGPITVFCSSQMSFHWFALSEMRWQHSLYLLTIFMLFCGFLTLISFNSLFKLFQDRSGEPAPETFTAKEPFSQKLLSLSSSLRYLVRSPYLTALFIIVVAEYISFALGELIFLETLKEMYPTTSDYCQYMGSLTLWTGVLTALSALIFTPYLLQTFRWSHNALITPAFLVLVTGVFFSVIYCKKSGLLSAGAGISMAVLFGSIHFCMGRATKYTLFDATKELAFIPLSQEGQMKGKLVIDGIGSRFGRGASSSLSIALFFLFGGPQESAIFAGILAILFAMISIPAFRLIGREFEAKAKA